MGVRVEMHVKDTSVALVLKSTGRTRSAVDMTIGALIQVRDPELVHAGVQGRAEERIDPAVNARVIAELAHSGRDIEVQPVVGARIHTAALSKLIVLP